MISLLSISKECYICHSTNRIELHHIFGGTSIMRKNCEKNGFIVYLCDTHHRGNNSVHRDREVDLMIKRKAQEEYERTHTRDEFMEIVKRSYL